MSHAIIFIGNSGSGKDHAAKIAQSITGYTIIHPAKDLKLFLEDLWSVPSGSADTTEGKKILLHPLDADYITERVTSFLATHFYPDPPIAANQFSQLLYEFGLSGGSLGDLQVEIWKFWCGENGKDPSFPKSYLTRAIAEADRRVIGVGFRNPSDAEVVTKMCDLVTIFDIVGRGKEKVSDKSKERVIWELSKAHRCQYWIVNNNQSIRVFEDNIRALVMRSNTTHVPRYDFA
jgi:hypothetical protein